MACFFGAEGGEAGSAASRRVTGGSGGQEHASAGCGPMVPHNSWVCAVLPVDSCSEGEDAADEDSNPEADSGLGPEVSASTCTPMPAAGAPEADGDPMVLSSHSPSDCRSERSR